MPKEEKAKLIKPSGEISEIPIFIQDGESRVYKTSGVEPGDKIEMLDFSSIKQPEKSNTVAHINISGNDGTVTLIFANDSNNPINNKQTKNKGDNREKWYKKPIGIVGLTIFGGLMCALAFYALNYYGLLPN